VDDRLRRHHRRPPRIRYRQRVEGRPSIDVPIFVVTHQAPTHVEWRPRVSFVTDGIERALELAQKPPGDLKVSVCAAPICATALCAVDESQGRTGRATPGDLGRAVTAKRSVLGPWTYL